MRCDLVLSRLCLFKTRSQASKACDESRVWINDLPARASKEIHVGDRIRFRDSWGRAEEEVRILEIPERSVGKAMSRSLYVVLSRTRIDAAGDPAGFGDGESA